MGPRDLQVVLVFPDKQGQKVQPVQPATLDKQDSQDHKGHRVPLVLQATRDRMAQQGRRAPQEIGEPLDQQGPPVPPAPQGLTGSLAPPALRVFEETLVRQET